MLNDYFPRRTDIVIGQFERLKWFTAGQAPEFSVNGTPQYGGPVVEGSTLSMDSPEGVIYFTADGRDPRLPGGEVTPGARRTPPP